MIKEQFRLLKHYQGIAKNEIKNRGKDYKPIIRENAQKHADDILRGNPTIETQMKEILEQEKKKETKSKEQK